MTRTSNTTKLVAIVGGSGAGKSWLADHLCRLLGDRATRLSLDSFYRDRSHLSPGPRQRINFDHPRAIDWRLVEQVLEDCRAGRAMRLPGYDFRTHARTASRGWWRPKRIVLVDGLWLLQRPALRRAFDLRVFIECPERVRLARRLGRDLEHRGRDAGSVRRQFRSTVAPMHRRFVAPQMRWADLVLEHPLSGSAIDGLADRLSDLVSAWDPAWRREAFRARLRAVLRSGSTSTRTSRLIGRKTRRIPAAA